MSSVIDRLRVQGNGVPPVQQDHHDQSGQAYRKDSTSAGTDLLSARRLVTQLGKEQAFNNNSHSINGPAVGTKHLARAHIFNGASPVRETLASFYGATTIGGQSVLKGKAGRSYLALMHRHNVLRPQQQQQDQQQQQQKQLAGSHGATGGFELAGLQVTPVGSDVMKEVEDPSPRAPMSCPRLARSRTKAIQRLLKSRHAANYGVRPVVPDPRDCEGLQTCLLVLPSPPPGRTASAPAPNTTIPALGRSPASRGGDRRSAPSLAVPLARKSAPPLLLGSSRQRTGRRRVSNSEGKLATPAAAASSSSASAAGPRPALLASRGSSSPQSQDRGGQQGALTQEVKGREQRYVFDSLASYVQFNNLYPALKKLRASGLQSPDRVTSANEVHGEGAQDSSADPQNSLKGLVLTSRNGGTLQPSSAQLARFPIHSIDSVRKLRQLLALEMAQPGPVKGVALGPPPPPTSPLSPSPFTSHAGGAVSQRVGPGGSGRKGLDHGQDQAQLVHHQQPHQQREQHHPQQYYHHHHHHHQHQEHHQYQHQTHTSGEDQFPAIITVSLTPKVKGIGDPAHGDQDDENDDDDDDDDDDHTAGVGDHDEARQAAPPSTVRSQGGEAQENEATERGSSSEPRQRRSSPRQEAKDVHDVADDLVADKTAVDEASLGNKERAVSA